MLRFVFLDSSATLGMTRKTGDRPWRTQNPKKAREGESSWEVGGSVSLFVSVGLCWLVVCLLVLVFGRTDAKFAGSVG